MDLHQVHNLKDYFWTQQVTSLAAFFITPPLKLFQAVTVIKSTKCLLGMLHMLHINLRACSGGGMFWTVSSCLSYRLPAG